MATLNSIPAFTQRVPMQFVCPDNPNLSLDGTSNPVIQNNPNGFFIQVGSVARIDLGLNGRTYFRGDGEYAPFAINLSWDCLGITDYNALAALRPYFIHMVTFRNLGYYGKLVMSGPQSVKGAGDAVSTQGTFYVLTPSDESGATPVTRLDNPSDSGAYITSGIAPGYIPANIPQYYWLTFSSIWGETDAFFIGEALNPSANQANTISWSWPSATGYCEKASLYVGSSNNVGSSLLLAEIPNGLTPVWNDIVGFTGAVVSQQPPTANVAYRGLWANGIWQNEN